VVAASTGTFYGRKMTPGDIYTVAGNGKAGASGNGGLATKADLEVPRGVSVDAAGNLLLADSGSCRVRVVAGSTGTFYGQPMTAGHIYTVAGDGTCGFSGDGGPATSATLNNPQGVAVDAAGNLLVADAGRVRVVAARAGTFYGQQMTAGDIYTVAGNGRSMYSGDGGPATSAEFGAPAGLAVDAAGDVAVADIGNSTVRVIAGTTGTHFGQPMTAGDIYTVAGDGTAGFAGDGGPATSAAVNYPWGVAVDALGNLVIADTDNNRIRVVAASTGTFYGQPMTAGDIYTIAGNGKDGFGGDGGPATTAELYFPEEVAVDAAGNLLIADTNNNRVRVVAASTGTFYGQQMTAGDIYTVTGDGTAGFSGDGGPATTAELNLPQAVAVDAAGNLLIGDGFNTRVRVVAASTGTFYGQQMTAGDIYTVAGGGTDGLGDGGPATSAELGFPEGIVVDSAGNLVIAASNRVRLVAATTGSFYGQPVTAGDIYTIAGNGKDGFGGDGGPATSAEIWSPVGLAVNSTGNLLIGDDGGRRVRMVTG
jgi:secreted PhoX family phosphatase